MMQEKTLIYINSLESLKAHWLIWDEAANLSFGKGSLEHIPDAVKKYTITVIIPAADVLVTEVKLPKLSRHRVLQALPFALEEQLIEETDNLHFALGKYDASHGWPVAIIAHKKIEEWILSLKKFNIHPQYLISSLFALPSVKNQVAMYVQDSQCVIRTSDYQGVTTTIEALTQMFDLLPSTSGALSIYTTQSVQLPRLPIQHETMVLNEIEWLRNMSQCINDYPHINLLQGHYQPAARGLATQKIWQAAAAIGAALIVLLVMGQCMSWFVLHHQVNKLQTNIAVIYKKYFPDATAVVAPRERLQAIFNGVITESKNNFLFSLALFAEVLAHHREARLHAMDFRDNQLNVELSANSFNYLEILAQALQERGFIVKQQNATTTGAEVKSNFILEKRVDKNVPA